MNCSETKTAINQDGMSELDLYRKRYRHCRRLIDNDSRFKGMSEEEKDTYAQSLATPEYLDLTCDWAFKYLFQNHPDMLIMLLNDILQENITSVEFRNTELAKDAQHDKRILFDLLCKTPSGTILVEMQKASRSDQRDRLFFYGARLVNRQVEEGDKEYVLTPVKVICIMNYEDVHPDSPEDKILYHYRIQEVDTQSHLAIRFRSTSLSYRGSCTTPMNMTALSLDGAEYSGISLSLPSRGPKMTSGLADWRRRCV